MHKTQKTMTLALGGAFVLSMSVVNINAAENPFSIKMLANGYQVADHHDKDQEGKCGAGKCGSSMEKSEDGKSASDKSAEGKCGSKQPKEGSCGSEKMKEGSCGSHQ